MDTNRLCPSCQKPLAPDVPMGLCPECLIKSGFPTGVETDTGSATQAAFVPPTVEEIAKLFPQLEILELIGKGGMGAVYKARQKQLNRFVALKILPPGIGDEPAFAERFTREARALAQLNHPNIVTLYEFGETSGQFYFLMEFVDGVNLRQLLASSRVSPREALAIVPQICDALQYAHDQGIIHRDIKPENILLDRRGRVKVADFGLAKLVGGESESAVSAYSAGSPSLTVTGKTMGTPNYMSPEQKEHPDTVDNRADIYALGVVFYQMLTGELPGKKIEPPSSKVLIDVRLDEVVLRALEKKPELRYQQVSEVKTMVETIAQTPEAESMPQFSEKHHRAPWSQGLVLASLLCMGACLWPAFVLFKQGGGSSLLTGSLLVALTLVCALFAIRGYTITADAILIHRLFWATRLPLAGLKSARFELAAAQWAIRAGNGGFFSCTGFRYNRSLGFYRVFVTDGARTVVLRYANRTVVVSPADPEAFVRDLATLPSQPSIKNQKKTMQTINTNAVKSFWRGAVMIAGVAACVVLAVFAILFLFKNQIILGPPDSGASSAGADWFPDWKGGGSVSVDFNDPATKGGYDFVLNNTSNFVAGVDNYAVWRCPYFSLGPAAGGAKPISFSFTYKLDDPVAARNNLRVQLCFWDSTGTNFMGERDIDVGAHTGDSAMTSYRTLTIKGIMVPPKAQTMYIAILANINHDLLWDSGTGRFANISVTTAAHSLLVRSCASMAALIGLYALIVLLALFWRRSAPALPSSPMALPDQSQSSTQTMNAGTIKSFWRVAVIFTGVAACVVLTGFGIRLLLKNQVMLGPPGSGTSSAIANWIQDTKGGGSVAADFNDPATKGGCDFVLSNSVAGPENNAECRCPFFPLGPAAGGARPITFSFAYKLVGPVAAGNNMRVQLRFWDANGNKFINERVIYVGARTSDSDMTGYRTVTVTGIKAPRNAQMADVWVNANCFEPWASGTGQFDDFSVTTAPHSLLSRAGIAGTGFIGIGALILLLVRYWRWSAPAYQAIPMATPAQPQPSARTMDNGSGISQSVMKTRILIILLIIVAFALATASAALYWRYLHPWQHVVNLDSFYQVKYQVKRLAPSPHSHSHTTDNNLNKFPAGYQIFNNVRFNVAGLIQLANEGDAREKNPPFPTGVEGIPVNRFCRSIHLLHGTVLDTDNGTVVASLILHYADGTTNKLDLIYGQQVYNWWFQDSDADAPLAGNTKVAWVGENPASKIHVFQTSFANPKPERKIESVDYVSGLSKCAPFMLALTVE